MGWEFLRPKQFKVMQAPNWYGGGGRVLKKILYYREVWIFSGTIQYYLVSYRPAMHAKGYSRGELAHLKVKGACQKIGINSGKKPICVWLIL